MKRFAPGVGDTFTEKHATHALLVEADDLRLGIVDASAIPCLREGQVVTL